MGCFHLPMDDGIRVFLVYPIDYTISISFTQYTGLGTQSGRLGKLPGNDQRRQIWSAGVQHGLLHLFAVPVGVVVAMVLALAMNHPYPRYQSSERSSNSVGHSTFHPRLHLSGADQSDAGNLQPNIHLVRGAQHQLVRRPHLRQARTRHPRSIRRRAGGDRLSGRAKGNPSSLHEAAALDGASTWRRFWNITLPLMTPVILYDIILGLGLACRSSHRSTSSAGILPAVRPTRP